MTEQIAKLLEFQKADLAVDAAEKKLRSSKERKTATLMKQRYELAVEERKKLIARRDETENEVQAISSEVEKLASLAETDRTKDAPEDIDAIKKLVADIDKLASALKKAEEKLKKIDSEVESNEKKINEYAAAANKAKDEFNSNKAEYEKMLENAKPEIDKLKKEREALAAKVDKTLLAKYERLKKNKIVPTAPLTDNRCGGCHMGMPSFTLSNAAKNGYCECENCGRIAYIE